MASESRKQAASRPRPPLPSAASALAFEHRRPGRCRVARGRDEGVGHVERGQGIAQRPPDQELHRQVVDTLGAAPTVCGKCLVHPQREFGAAGVCDRLHPDGRRGFLRGVAAFAFDPLQQRQRGSSGPVGSCWSLEWRLVVRHRSVSLSRSWITSFGILAEMSRYRVARASIPLFVHRRGYGIPSQQPPFRRG